MTSPIHFQTERIDEQAAAWLVEREGGISPEQERAFDAWLAADERHRIAYTRLERASGLLQQLPFAADRFKPATQVRRTRSVWPWAAAVACAAVLVLGILPWKQPLPSQALAFATAASGHERALLPDGSTVELNADTRVKAQFAPDARRVELLAGEAHFLVAHDPERPFIVAADGVAVRALGTAFNVRRAGASVEVLVTHGQVRVSHTGPTAAVPTLSAVVSAGERVIMPNGSGAPAPRVERVSPEEVRRKLAWQERQLVFHDSPLRLVIQQFNAHNPTQLRLGDAAVGERLVGGTFAARHVDAFVRLLESSGDVVVERNTAGDIVLRTAR